MPNYKNWSDAELIRCYKQGDNDAFGALVKRHQSALLTFIHAKVNDRYRAEDLLQDVFFKIIDTIRNGRYQEEGKFLSWALRIAHNFCVDHFRRVNRTPTIINSDGNDIFEWIAFTEESPETKMMREQSKLKVMDMLMRLPAEQREVIVLRHFGEMSFKEIAELTGNSINTELGRHRYGLINLRKMAETYQLAL